MLHHLLVLPEKRNMEAAAGARLLDVLRGASLLEDAPCGGNGRCGKCRVIVDGEAVLACQVTVDHDMTVELPERQTAVILTEGILTALSADSGVCLAIDIGTTTVAAYLTENGRILASESRKNPQAAYGADVVSRIRHAANGKAPELTAAIRICLEDMTKSLLAETGKNQLSSICIVGNPPMQQLFLGLGVENLIRMPFHPLLKQAETADGGHYIPLWAGVPLLTVPDIAGYIGADTVACILAAGMHQSEKLTLLVDIGTNGEIVLGSKDRLVACATAAGPALEGAGIRFGMQAAHGAIDHVGADFSCHVIGGGPAAGICGSGLLDAVAAALGQGLINERGRIQNETRTLPLADGLYLTQEDIRQLQQAKGAVAAGIHLLAAQLGVSLQDIDTVYLAGAFGTFLDPHSACRIGLLPAELESKIIPIGNAAGSGARLMACDSAMAAAADAVAADVEHLELATHPRWARAFADGMRFTSEETYWCKKAVEAGFSDAAALDPATLSAREDVRAMCVSDRCSAYGKNWTCPPHCGSLKECEEAMGRLKRGILVQTVGKTRKAIDSRAYRETEAKHLQQFYALAEAIRAAHPGALCLGSGGCRICKTCAYPLPCRFPEKACPSMEAYGLFVTDVCRKNGLAYHHGENTITYTGCILF